LVSATAPGYGLVPARHPGFEGQLSANCQTTCGRGTGRDNRYGVTVLPIPSLETNFPTIGIDGIFDLLKKKTSLGDALIMAVARKQLPFVSTMITWDDDHFEGKFPGTVLTSEEFMWSAELV